MLLVILLFLKFLLFSIFTNASYCLWLSIAIDLLVLGAFWLLARKRGRGFETASLAVYVLLSLIIFADLFYFSYFNRMPSVRELGHAGNLGDVTDAVFKLIKPRTLLVIIDLPVIIYLAVKKKLHVLDDFFDRYKELNFKIWPYMLMAFSALVVVSGHRELKGVSHLNFFTYHAIDTAGLETEPDSEDESRTTAILKGILEYKAQPNEFTGIAKGKNLIVIQVESLNNFVIGSKYNRREICPNLNALIAEKGTVYAEDYFEVLGAGNTSDAEFVSLHSLFPSMKNPSYEVYLNSYLYGLPKIMKDKGYENIALHGFKRDFWIRDRAYEHIGFDKFVAEDNFDCSDKIGMGLSDMSFFEQSLPFLEKMKRPFFSFLVTLTSHIPYEMPENEREIPILPEDEGSIFGNYINAVHYTDKALGTFIDGLKKAGLYQDSVIAIYGDHHAFNETVEADLKRIEKITGKPFDYDTMLNIPLIIHIGGSDKKLVTDKVASQLDLTPTLLNMLGVDRTGLIMFGKDIFSEDNPHVLYPQSYMLRGSYIDDDNIFTMSRDAIFENGTLKDRKTREKSDVEKAREKYENAVSSINLCRRILEEDRLQQLMVKAKSGDVSGLESDGADFKPDDAVNIKNEKEMSEAYRAGYRNMRVELEMTKDGFFSSHANAHSLSLENQSGDFLTLGSLIGGEYPDDMEYIIYSKNAVELSEQLKALPGLHKNIMLEVDDFDDYMKISYKSNGYKVLLNAQKSGLDEQKLKSLAENNAELYFLNSDIKELDERTIHTNGESPSIISVEDAVKNVKSDAPKKFVRQNINLDRYVELDEGEMTWEKLASYSGEYPEAVLFKLGDEKELVSVTDVRGDKRLTGENINELLDENKSLKIAVRTESFTVEVLRSILKNHPDMDRIYPVLNALTQIPHAKKMGYKNILLDMELPYRVRKEIGMLWGVGFAVYRQPEKH